MKYFAALICSLIVSHAFAEDITIVDARRNIPLSDDEPVYKDFYLNAGESSGLKKNMVVTAMRKWSIRDAAGAQSIGDVEVPVGQLKVLAVFGKVAIAREYKLPNRDDLPMIEQPGLMAGDRIDLKGSFVDDKSMAPKHKVAEVKETPAVATVVVAAVGTAEPAKVPEAKPEANVETKAVSEPASVKVASASEGPQSPKEPPASSEPKAKTE